MSYAASLGAGHTRSRPRHRQVPPVLDQILNGGRCVSLPVARMCLSLPHPRRLFQQQSLNRTFIFKLPVHDPDQVDLSQRRPLDTGVFVPYDESDPGRGGFALYCRERRAHERFRELLGISLDSPECARDARVLHLLDELPSLDPFLLKDCFLRAGVDVDDAFTMMAEDDVEGVRAVMRRQLYPILARAMSGMSLERRLDRLVADIFTPGLGEAMTFLSAFGVRPEDVPSVYGAWKGIAFYRSSINRHASPLASALRWLKSKEALPAEISRLGDDAQRLTRMRTTLVTNLAQLLQQIDGIFIRADGHFDELARNADAGPFRQFLRESCDSFWVLGRAAAAIAHGTAAFRTIGWPDPERPTLAKFESLLLNLDLASRRGMPASGSTQR